MKYKYTLLHSEDSEIQIGEDVEVQIEPLKDLKSEKKKNDLLERIEIKETRLLDSKIKNRNDNQIIHEHRLLPFPYKVFYIIGSEFCERFSFYGLRAVLVLYLSNVLLLGEDSATSLFHGWTFLCYFTPIFGALLADSLLGRFRTIFYLSFIYLIGNVVLSLASTTPIVPNVSQKLVVSTIGLVLIAFGTGGIKPCVSAFGGDQFELPQQEHQLSKFFSVFYFSINAGALLSTFLTPLLREDVSCFGGQCFPLAFGVPALLMFVALVLFFVGSPHYKKVPPEGNIGSEVFRCITYAGCKKIKIISSRISACLSRSTKFEITDTKPNSHWLHLAEDRFSPSLIEDVKTLLAVLFLFIPLPLFWALYDQQGSRWTFQAAKLSGTLGFWTIKPDQMQILNPILIMMMIPFFQTVVYPFLSRWKILSNCLHRMFIGGLLASLAFIVSGFLQISIENDRPLNIQEGKFSLTVLNTISCPVSVELSSLSHVEDSHVIPSLDMLLKHYDENHFEGTSNNTVTALFKVKLDSQCDSTVKSTTSIKLEIKERNKRIFLVLTSYLGNIEIVPIPQVKKDQKKNLFRVVDTTDYLRLSPIYLREDNKTIKIKSNFYSKGISASSTKTIPDGSFELILPGIAGEGKEESLGIFTASPSTLLFLFSSPSFTQISSKSMKIFNMSVPSVHMMWLLPQYILISIAEIMFAITGLEFSFKQAPSSMKSVVQAAWLLTNAFGNLLVVVVAKGKFFSTQSLEFFLFAALMIIDMLVFYVLASRYNSNSNKNEEYKDYNRRNEDFVVQDSPFKDEIKEEEEEEFSFNEDNDHLRNVKSVEEFPQSSDSDSLSSNEELEKHKDSNL